MVMLWFIIATREEAVDPVGPLKLTVVLHGMFLYDR